MAFTGLERRTLRGSLSLSSMCREARVRVRVRSSGTDSTVVCLQRPQMGRGVQGRGLGWSPHGVASQTQGHTLFSILAATSPAGIAHYYYSCPNPGPASQSGDSSARCPSLPKPFMAPHGHRCYHRMGTLMSVGGSLRNSQDTVDTLAYLHWSISNTQHVGPLYR